MVASRPDWCISRQRVWGVPIPIFLCDGCDQPLKSKAADDAVVALFAHEGADAWYTREVDEILPADVRCQECGKQTFRKESDILDVWFESGSSWAAVMGDLVADLYTEGGDQHRGWFQSSLLCSVGSRNRSPYRMCMTSGWTLDPQGRPMSKSLGNGVDPVEVTEKLGAEIVRLWVASVDFREDVHGSDELMQRVADNYRKIRNTFRYILGNLNGFDPERDQVTFEEMESLDRYMMLRLADLVTDVRRWYEEFAFHRIYHRVLEFCTVDVSAVYFDVLRDRLYTYAPEWRSRRSGQTAIWRIGQALVRLLAPIMSFTAEEVWQLLPAIGEKPQSVHLALFPTCEEVLGNTTRPAGRSGQPLPAETDATRADWDKLMRVREEVFKALELARKEKMIGSGLEAKVELKGASFLIDFLQRYQGVLRYLFIVSQVELLTDENPRGIRDDTGFSDLEVDSLVESLLGKGSGLPTSGNPYLAVRISRAEGKKCERCWNYSTQVGSDPAFPTVCERCSAALKDISNDRENGHH
jgi:isoleucyl-tRNA synthetase